MTYSPRRNSYPGSCNSCKAKVEPSSGYINKESGGWKTYCASTQCLPKSIRDSIEEANNAPRALTIDGRVLMPFERDSLPLLRSMPGARWDKSAGCWTVSLDPADRTRVLELADKLKLDVPDDLRSFDLGDDVRAAVEAAEQAGAYPFQLRGVEFLASHKRALLGDDMGLGKTCEALWALDANAGALAVVPAAVKHNWAAECRRWRPDINPTVLSGRRSFRWPLAGELVIINPDILPTFLDDTLSDAHKAAAQATTLIADEAHLYKSYKAKRSKRMQRISKSCGRAWALTGTPMVNRPFDLYGVLSSFGLDRDVFGGWKGFLRCFQGYKTQWGGYEFGGPLPEVPERMRRVMLRRTKAEVLPDLPAKQFQTIEVNGLPAHLQSQMDQRWDDYCDAGAVDELPSIDQMSKIRAELATHRIGAMLELVESYEDSETPLVVACAHRAPILALGEREGWASITGSTSSAQRQVAVEQFQAGKLKGIGITIAAGGVGITLTRASTMLFVDLDWTPALNLQCEDRICRIGQTGDKVHYIRLVSTHVLDQHVNNLLASKIEMIRKAIDSEIEEITPTDRQSFGVVEETEESMTARLAQYESAERKATELANLNGQERKLRQAQDRVEDWARRQSDRATVPARELTPEVVEATRGALDYMLSVCDGAVAEDGVGFNKPDASIARWLAQLSWEDGNVVQAAERMLTRYPGQLSGQFPVLFDGGDQ